MTRSSRFSVAVLAALLAAPAALFFLAAIGRTLQPTTHEPARTLDVLVNWFLGLGGLGLLVLLVVLPFVGAVIAAALLWRTWRADPALRSDLAVLGRAVLPFLRRPAVFLAALVVVFGAAYFAALFVHALAG